MQISKKHKPFPIGRKISLMRQQRNLSMRALAGMVGTSQQQIDRLEKGQRRMTIEWLDKISKALDCNLKEFISGEDYKDRNTDENGERNFSLTAKAKVIGSIESDGKIIWFDKFRIYPIVFGRPESGSRFFALLDNSNGQYGFPGKSELIFSEIDAGDKIAEGKLQLYERISFRQKTHFLSRNPNNEAIAKAILVKTIRSE